MDIQEIKGHIVKFLKDARAIELYNEFSLQHELGIYLRKVMKGYSIQFERNISFFGYDDSLPSKCKWKEQEWVKKEIDIVIFNDKEKFAIELKFPRNSASCLRRMFQFIEDIRFLEQLKDAGFDGGCALVLVDDKNFYTKTGRESYDIYQYFRVKRKIEKDENGINNPYDEKPSKVYINGSYEIKWCKEINFCGRDKYNGEKESKNDEWAYYIVTF